MNYLRVSKVVFEIIFWILIVVLFSLPFVIIMFSKCVKIIFGVIDLILMMLVFFHMLFSLGLKDSIKFALIGFSIGFLSELSGVLFGIPFGKYHYTEFFPVKILGLVPVGVPISWAVFAYIVYSMSSSITQQESTMKTNIVCSIIDGFLLTLFDLVMDPVMVSIGAWIWEEPGPYYGIPISNFIGWFFVGFTITFTFRMFSTPRKLQSQYQTNSSVMLYCDYVLFMSLIAVTIGLTDICLFGIILAVFISSLFFLRKDRVI